MIIETEPSGLMMIRYKFYFNQHTPDPEDPWILEYFKTHGLEPRRELHEEHEGIPYKVLHFGQCYLGRHVNELSQLYQRGIEHTVLAQHVSEVLAQTSDTPLRTATAGLEAAARQSLARTVAAQLHATTQFEATEDRSLRVVLDEAVIREAVQAVQSATAP